MAQEESRRPPASTFSADDDVDALAKLRDILADAIQIRGINGGSVPRVDARHAGLSCRRELLIGFVPLGGMKPVTATEIRIRVIKAEGWRKRR